MHLRRPTPGNVGCTGGTLPRIVCGNSVLTPPPFPPPQRCSEATRPYAAPAPEADMGRHGRKHDRKRDRGELKKGGLSSLLVSLASLVACCTTRPQLLLTARPGHCQVDSCLVFATAAQLLKSPQCCKQRPPEQVPSPPTLAWYILVCRRSVQRPLKGYEDEGPCSLAKLPLRYFNACGEHAPAWFCGTKLAPGGLLAPQHGQLGWLDGTPVASGTIAVHMSRRGSVCRLATADGHHILTLQGPWRQAMCGLNACAAAPAACRRHGHVCRPAPHTVAGCGAGAGLLPHCGWCELRQLQRCAHGCVPREPRPQMTDVQRAILRRLWPRS